MDPHCENVSGECVSRGTGTRHGSAGADHDSTGDGTSTDHGSRNGCGTGDGTSTDHDSTGANHNDTSADGSDGTDHDTGSDGMTGADNDSYDDGGNGSIRSGDTYGNRDGQGSGSSDDHAGHGDDDGSGGSTGADRNDHTRESAAGAGTDHVGDGGVDKRTTACVSGGLAPRHTERKKRGVRLIKSRTGDELLEYKEERGFTTVSAHQPPIPNHGRDYKAYATNHLPYFQTLAEYEAPNFDPSAYEGEKQHKREQLKQYLAELEPYAKVLTEAARLRQADFERRFKDTEDATHRHWRINFNQLAEDAREKVRVWTTRLADLNVKTEVSLDRISAKEFEARRTQIDLDAQNAEQEYPSSRHQRQPPRLTPQMKQQRKEEKLARRAKRDVEERATLDSAIAARKPSAPISAVSLNGPGSAEFWQTALAQLTEANRTYSQAMVPLLRSRGECVIAFDVTMDHVRADVGRQCFLSVFLDRRPRDIVASELEFFFWSFGVRHSFITEVVERCLRQHRHLGDVLTGWQLYCLYMALPALAFNSLVDFLNKLCPSPDSQYLVATPMMMFWRESFVLGQVKVARRVIALVQTGCCDSAKAKWERDGYIVDQAIPAPVLSRSVQLQYARLGQHKQILQELKLQLRKYEDRGTLPAILKR